jgi:DNA (cytosine-5)-methyltransferase 1
MRDREGAAGGGKGPLVSNKAFTLATSNFHTIFPNSATVRRLTPTECERLQGFPDGWTAEQADSNRYKQMGNAVAVPVVQWIINNVVGEE